MTAGKTPADAEIFVPDVSDAKLYLQPHSNWFEADASWFAAYFFGAGDIWQKMTDDDNDGIYECNIPEGGYTQVIFCQMRNDNQTLSWGAKKNQTVDLTIPADNNVLFVVETPWGDESNGWKATGRWSAL